MRPIRLFAAAAALLTWLPAHAANIVIGLSADVTAIDPHYHNLTPNNAVATHLFDFLVARNEKSQLLPGLATEWKAIEPTVWEFKLRKGVRFSDGKPVTSKDVVFSLSVWSKGVNFGSSFSRIARVVDSATRMFLAAYRATPA